jgi:hypothetical protein
MEVVVGASVLGGVMIAVLVVVGVVAMLLVVPKLVLKRMEPALERRISAVYTPGEVVLKDLKAATLGLESRGVLQGRGNGALVLTASELGWFRFMPAGGDLRVPRESITKVDTVKSHLGKTYGRDLLRVTFTQDGRPDSMAWYVTDLNAWLATLDEPAVSTTG